MILKESLSARRAWIEMLVKLRTWKMRLVALRKESVDRNINIECLRSKIDRRSPQGERG